MGQGPVGDIRGQSQGHKVPNPKLKEQKELRGVTSRPSKAAQPGCLSQELTRNGLIPKRGLPGTLPAGSRQVRAWAARSPQVQERDDCTCLRGDRQGSYPGRIPALQAPGCPSLQGTEGQLSWDTAHFPMTLLLHLLNLQPQGCKPFFCLQNTHTHTHSLWVPKGLL